MAEREYVFDFEVIGRVVGTVDARNKAEAMEKVLNLSRDVDWIHLDLRENKPRRRVTQ